MNKTILLKAEEGKVYHHGKIYAKAVRVIEEWAKHWTLVDIEEAKANKGLVLPQFLHILKENL